MSRIHVSRFWGQLSTGSATRGPRLRPKPLVTAPSEDSVVPTTSSLSSRPGCNESLQRLQIGGCPELGELQQGHPGWWALCPNRPPRVDPATLLLNPAGGSFEPFDETDQVNRATQNRAVRAIAHHCDGPGENRRLGDKGPHGLFSGGWGGAGSSVILNRTSEGGWWQLPSGPSHRQDYP